MHKIALIKDTINKVEDRILPLIEDEEIKNKLHNKYQNILEHIPDSQKETSKDHKTIILHVFQEELPIDIDLNKLKETLHYQMPQLVDLATFESLFKDVLPDHLQEERESREPMILGEFWPTEEMLFIDGKKRYASWKNNEPEYPHKYVIANTEMIINATSEEVDKLLLMTIKTTYIAQEYAYYGESDFPI
ncbi:hypothetical protein [Kandleria vitulina]|uniref:hypothetical protein n=1 Tax=Kandleria vitulina TaxID=1630 RepID=UPI000B2F7FC1|nr:hypothetical protein [Kandleria vitulina]